MGRDEKVKFKPKNQNFLLTPCITGLKFVLETGLKSKFRPYVAPGGQYLGYQRPRQQGHVHISVISVFFGIFFTSGGLVGRATQKPNQKSQNPSAWCEVTRRFHSGSLFGESPMIPLMASGRLFSL